MYNMSGSCFSAQHDFVPASLPSTEELHQHFLAAGQAANEADITLPGSVQADVPLLARGMSHRLDVTFQQGVGGLAPTISFPPLGDLLHAFAAASSSGHDEHVRLAGAGGKAAVSLFDKGVGHAAQQEHLARVLAASHDPAVSSEALAAGTAQQATHAVTAAHHAAHHAAEHEGLSWRDFDDFGGGDWGGDDYGGDYGGDDGGDNGGVNVDVSPSSDGGASSGGDGGYQSFIDRPIGLNGGGGPHQPQPQSPPPAPPLPPPEIDNHICKMVDGVYYDKDGHPVDHRAVDMTNTYPPSSNDTDAKPFYTQKSGFIAGRQGARPGDGWDQAERGKAGDDGHLGFKAQAPGLYHDMFGKFDPLMISRDGYEGQPHVIYQGTASYFMPEHVQAYGNHLDDKVPGYGDDVVKSAYWRDGADHGPAIQAYKEAMAHTDIAQYALNTVSRHYQGRDMTADELRQHMDAMGQGKETLQDVNAALARQAGVAPQQLEDLMPTQSDGFIHSDGGRSFLRQEVSKITGEPLNDDQLAHYQTIYDEHGSWADVSSAAHQYAAAQEAAARERERLAQIKARDEWEAAMLQDAEDPYTSSARKGDDMNALFDELFDQNAGGSRSGALPATPKPAALTQEEKDQIRAQWQEQLNNSLADHGAMTRTELEAAREAAARLGQPWTQESWEGGDWRSSTRYFSGLRDFLADGVENTEQRSELIAHSSSVYFQVNRDVPVNTTLDDLLNTKAAWNLAKHYLADFFHGAEHVTQDVVRDFWQAIFPDADAAGRSKEDIGHVTQQRMEQMRKQYPQLQRQASDVFGEMKAGYAPEVSLSEGDKDQITRDAIALGQLDSTPDVAQLRMVLARSEGVKATLRDVLSHMKDQSGHDMSKVLATASQQDQAYCYEAAAQSIDRGGSIEDAAKAMAQTFQELRDHPPLEDGLEPYKGLVSHSERPTGTSVKQQTSRDDTPFLTKSFSIETSSSNGKSSSVKLPVTPEQASEMRGKYVHTGFSRDPDIGVEQMNTGYVPQGNLTGERKAELLAEDSKHHLTEAIIKAKKPFDYAGKNNSSGLTMGDGLDLSQHTKNEFIVWEVGPKEAGMSRKAYNELKEHSYAKQILDKVDDRFFSSGGTVRGAKGETVLGARGEYAEYLRETTGLSLTHNEVDFLQTIYDRHILGELTNAYDYSHGAGAWEGLPKPVKEVLVNVMVSKPGRLIREMKDNKEDLSIEGNINSLIDNVLDSTILNSRADCLKDYVGNAFHPHRGQPRCKWN